MWIKAACCKKIEVYIFILDNMQMYPNFLKVSLSEDITISLVMF